MSTTFSVILVLCTIIHTTISQNCGTARSSDDCARVSGCGWCGLSYTSGSCVASNADGSGPSIGKCRLFWDNRLNCMYRGKADSDDCTKSQGCGWCGATYNNGTCVPQNSSGTGPINSETCFSGLWDNKNCMYRGRADSDDCYKASPGVCGWCGTSYNKGTCLPINASKTGPVGSVCNGYWDTINCMYPGRGDSDDCYKSKAGSCGWCGPTYNSGVCLPVNSSRTGPEGVTCGTYWDPFNCMYPGRGDSDDCFKLGKCGWCGSSYNSGTCLPKVGNSVFGNTCNANWDSMDCLYKGRNDPNTCRSVGCQWCAGSSLCLPSCDVTCSVFSNYSQCSATTGCGWCATYLIGEQAPFAGSCIPGNEYAPKDSASICNNGFKPCDISNPSQPCPVYDGSGCGLISDEISCLSRPPCMWCGKGSDPAAFCMSEVGVNNATLSWCNVV